MDAPSTLMTCPWFHEESFVTDRQAGLTYGALAACVVALTLLIIDYPSDRNLMLAIGAGLIVGFGSYFYLRTR